MTSSGDYCRWLQVRGSQLYEKLQNRRNSEAWNQIQCQSSMAQHPHCLTLGSRSQQRVISSSCSSWLGSSSVIPSSFRGFNSTRTHLRKRPIFVSFFCRFADSKQENIITGSTQDHCLSFQMHLENCIHFFPITDRPFFVHL